MNDIEELIRLLKSRGLSNGSSLGHHSGLYDEAADALSALQTENNQLRAELERVKRERDAAVSCIYEIEDDLDRGNDNDWAREHIEEWRSTQKEK